MTWLTIWLKKIILLVLLAAFLDLILPNTSMQRYVKMVMGLIILLTLISPIFSLFNLSQEELALRLDRYQEAFDKPPEQEWKSIMQRLVGSRDEQVAEYVKSQLEASIRARVKEVHGVDLRSVDVQLDTKQPEHPKISEIRLVVGESDADGESGSTVQPVRPVEPVVISIGGSSAEEEDRPVAAPPGNPLHRKIAETVAREWGVTPERVSVNGEADSVSKQ